jgi:hypothetical protein
MRFLVLAALAGVLAALALPTSAGAVTNGSISGTVTDAESGEPIEGVLVCVWSEETELSAEEGPCESTFAAGEYTNAAGEYTVGGLPAGSYRVEFWPDALNYVPQYYNGTSNWEEADEVVVGTSAVAGIDAAMEPALEISGEVTDASTSQPLGEVEVCAIDPSTLSFVRCTETNGSGEYALSHMQPGSYFVEFWPWVNFEYMTQYWDHVPYLSEAEAVEGLAGETISNVDAGLEKGGAFSGKVTKRATGGPLTGIVVCARRASNGEYERCASTGPTGAYEIPGLPSDPVKAEFSPEGGFFEPDGYLTQYWNDKPTLAGADSFAVSPIFKMLGVNAALDREGGTPPTVRPPTVTPPRPPVVTTPPAPVHHRHRCRPGFHRKRVHGKRRCVRIKKRHHHRHRHHG